MEQQSVVYILLIILKTPLKTLNSHTYANWQVKKMTVWDSETSLDLMVYFLKKKKKKDKKLNRDAYKLIDVGSLLFGFPWAAQW